MLGNAWGGGMACWVMHGLSWWIRQKGKAWWLRHGGDGSGPIGSTPSEGVWLVHTMSACVY